MKWNFVTGSLEKFKTEGLALGVFDDLNFGPIPEAAAPCEDGPPPEIQGQGGRGVLRL